MKKLIFLLFVVLSLLLTVPVSPASAAVKNHALAKVAKVVSAPVVHPVRSVKQVIGSVVFAVEAGNDVLLGALNGADKAASVEFKYNPFHYAALLDDKIDKGLEAGELYFFGSSN
jgi:hypothetical protein